MFLKIDMFEYTLMYSWWWYICKKTFFIFFLILISYHSLIPEIVMQVLSFFVIYCFRRAIKVSQHISHIRSSYIIQWSSFSQCTIDILSFITFDCCISISEDIDQDDEYACWWCDDAGDDAPSFGKPMCSGVGVRSQRWK